MPPATGPARVRRIAGRILLGLVVLLALTAGTVYALSERAMYRHVAVPAHAAPIRLGIATDSAARAAQLASGAHLVAARGCQQCHGANLGGHTLVEAAPIGRLVAANLTAGRRTGALSDSAWELALRHGVHPDGTPLLIMPSDAFANLSDADVAAIVAYVRTLPAARDTVPTTHVGPLLRALYLAGKADVIPADHIKQSAAHVADVTPAPTVAYGAYVAASCAGCHHADFAGEYQDGKPHGPHETPPRNITPHPTAGIGRWTEADFDRLLTTGVRPDGHLIDTVSMPVGMTKQLSPVEREALWAYLRTVPAHGVVPKS